MLSIQYRWREAAGADGAEALQPWPGVRVLYNCANHVYVLHRSAGGRINWKNSLKFRWVSYWSSGGLR